MIEWAAVRFSPEMVGNREVGKREKEKAMVSFLIRQVFGQSAIVGHTSEGAPFLESDPSLFISVTHSGDLAAIAWSRESPVGIDLQYPSPALRRVVSRFLSESQQAYWAASDERLLRAWTIKEAVFKAAGIPALSLFAIDMDEANLTATVELPGLTRRFHLEFPHSGLTICREISYL